MENRFSTNITEVMATAAWNRTKNTLYWNRKRTKCITYGDQGKSIAMKALLDGIPAYKKPHIVIQKPHELFPDNPIISNL